MNRLIEISLNRPMAVMAGVLMIIAFGLVALQTIPIQLTPDVRRPVIDIRTNWRGEAPVDVEREVTNRLEEVLGGIEGVAELSSRSRFGSSRIRLEFEIGYDLDKGLLLINNRLSGIDDLPREADEPRMDSRGSEDIPIAFFALRRKPGNTNNMEIYGDLIEDVIVDRIERVSGVSGVGFRGGSRRELRIVVDPEKMAYYRLTIPDVLRRMRDASASISAGVVEEGKRRYLVRTEGEIRTVAQAKAVVLVRQQDDATGRVGRVTVGDIAEVVYGYKDRTSYRRYLGEDVITLQAMRTSGANVIKTMDAIRVAIKDLNENILVSDKLYLTWIYDETVYIKSALALVQQNIWLGGGLAALILLLFLRSWRPTLVVVLAIPVSVIGAFVAMSLFGRSINVISLAGIAFAVGMVVDAAIVVLENIYRHREMGKPPMAAALEGTKEVWPAVFASALTTVVVFAPVLMLKLQVGQLFRDIAVALSVAVMLSLIVSVTVIPALSKKLLTKVGKDGAGRLRIPGLDHFGRGFVRVVMGFTGIIVRSKTAALLVVCAVVGGTGAFTYFAMPPLDFLPDGNRNFVWGRISPPPGYNLKTMKRVAEDIEAGVRPYWASVSGPESKPGEPPKIKHFFFVARADRAFVGASAVDPTRAGELEDLIEKPILKEPGTRASVRQSSIFSRGIGGSRSIRFDISGPDLEVNIEVARRADDLIRDVLPRSEGHRTRPRPGLELGAPEIRIIPDQLRLADAGLTARDLARTIDAFNDGIRIAEITIGNRRIDLTLTGPDNMVTETQGIANLPVVTPDGRIVPVSSLAEVKITAGPTQVWHLERTRYVQIRIRPSKKIPLETTINRLREEVMKPMREAGLPPGVKIRLSGAADNLTKTWNALKFDMLVAMAIVFLVMAVILESFLYPLIIMLSVPLATAGGMLGLWVMNIVVLSKWQWDFQPLLNILNSPWNILDHLSNVLHIVALDRQPLDMLTILGFIILIGTVVNNAILLVTYAVQNVRDRGMTPEAAILDSTRTRIRPIFMSTLTTVFGMLALVVLPGAGSELYRGLGSVVIGGLALSAILTLLIIPPLLSLMSWKLRREGMESEETATEPSPQLAE